MSYWQVLFCIMTICCVALGITNACLIAVARGAMKRCDELLMWNQRLLNSAESLQEDRDELRKRFLPGGWYAPGTTPAESAELRRAYRAKWNEP